MLESNDLRMRRNRLRIIEFRTCLRIIEFRDALSSEWARDGLRMAQRSLKISLSKDCCSLRRDSIIAGEELKDMNKNEM